VITTMIDQKIIGRPMLAAPHGSHSLLKLWIIFSFFLFFHPTLDMEQDTSTQSIVLAAPHLLAWSVAFDTPIKIAQNMP
jgi:hypothetical protein